MFVYQPTLDILEIRKDKCTDYVLSWSKSKALCNSKLNSIILVLFLHSIKFSRYKMGIKLDKDPLAVEQNKQNCKCLHCL